MESEKINKREQLDVLLYRDGPSTFEDVKKLLGENAKEDHSPQGLNEFIPHSSIVNFGISSGVAGSEVLLVYFARLGDSESDDEVDIDYVDLLIKSGANVNYQDSYGQTVMHEVALRWPISLAEYFLKHGANLNHGDKFGRTPLHVATSMNAPGMVKWLLINKADIHAKTIGENQTAIHFGAKYNAVDALVVLLEYGARIDDRDYKERTPLHLAAETAREKAVRLLLEYNAPAGVYDDNGTTCLTHMISNMPDVAASALEQFYRVEVASRTVYYYLSYLETEKWTMMREKSKLGSRQLTRREPLEAIIKGNHQRLIMHPVIQQLIVKKREMYGSRYFFTSLFVNIIFTTTWSVLTATLPQIHFRNEKDKEPVRFYSPLSEYLWRACLEIIGLTMALYFVIKMRMDSAAALMYFQDYKLCRSQELKRDLQYCHPRWPQEEISVRKQMENVESDTSSLYDAWYYIDMISFLGLVVLTVMRLVLVELMANMNYTYHVIIVTHYHIYPLVLIVIWLRLMQSFRPFITFGPFIAMFGYVVSDTIKFAFLFIEFYIPYCCSIWIVFGGPTKPWSYKKFHNVMFRVFQMTIVDDFEYKILIDENELVAQFICGTYFALASITFINLYIALLSETFTQVFGNATATAYMSQGEVLMGAERKMNKDKLQKFKSYVATMCSPEVVFDKSVGTGGSDAIRKIMSDIENLKRQCGAIKKIQSEMRPQLNYLKGEAWDSLKLQENLMREIELGLQRIEGRSPADKIDLK